MKNKKWVIGLGIIGIAIVALLGLNLGDNLVYFYTPGEAVAKAAELSHKDIRVGAMVKSGSVQWDDENLKLAFIATDNKGAEIAITHKGSPPDMFKEGQGVVVEGRISDNGHQMVSKNLFVKHSEEYKKPDDHSKMDAEYLQKSMFKNEKTN